MTAHPNERSYPIVVIGAGAAGLVIAIGATKAGKKVLLIEKGNYGGDCTNFGCIPSKSLIASGLVASSVKEGHELGVEIAPKIFQNDAALSRVRAVVKGIRSHEDPTALKKIGLETLTGKAAFIGPRSLQVNDVIIHAKQIVIATGSSPLIPEIPGLKETPFLTNETIFELEKIPKTLAVLGGGPIGCELAQAFSHLGSKVTLIQSAQELLGREEPEAQELISHQFKSDGIELYLKTVITEIRYTNNLFQIFTQHGEKIESEYLLISVGRKINLDSLNLKAAEVHFTEKGISVDAYGRTNQSHIWAVGDVVGSPFFTHRAENQARSVLTSLLLPFPFKKKIDVKQSVPRVTYTNPEIASIGLSEEEARAKYNIAIYRVPFSEVDRAITTGQTKGFVKIITKKWSSKILGCTIVGPRAGEMLMEVSLAMYAGIPLRKLSGLIHPYPTYNLAIRKASDLWLTQTILAIFKRKK